ALMHDVLITLSVYAIFDLSINSPFIAAILLL
ncbi:MAG: protein translocase subunit SecF, partial [Clostridium sp.]|nr:protein translocase subunit SecF [Clostridium sp.]